MTHFPPSQENLAGRLDPKGRCCGRKPIQYKRPDHPPQYCPRCDREYDKGGWQQPNGFYKRCPGCNCWISAQANACGECSCEDDCAP